MTQWRVEIHPVVFKEDFKKVPPSDQQEIVRQVRKKLTVAPEDYGEPLRGNYKNYWKLRVGDYRVIYRIEKQRVSVKVIKIGVRRDYQVYQ